MYMYLFSDGCRFRISYKDPVSGFDRSRVKGIVGRLVRVKDMATATALEVAAGGRVSYMYVCYTSFCLHQPVIIAIILHV